LVRSSAACTSGENNAAESTEAAAAAAAAAADHLLLDAQREAVQPKREVGVEPNAEDAGPGQRLRKIRGVAVAG
jgi:hypothetical protein